MQHMTLSTNQAGRTSKICTLQACELKDSHKQISFPEEAINIWSECILVSAMVNLTHDWLTNQVPFTSCATLTTYHIKKKTIIILREFNYEEITHSSALQSESFYTEI